MNRTSTWLRKPRKPIGEARRERSNAEARFQARVEELARYLGWLPVHVLNMKGTQAGLTDLILIRERVVWAELKAYSDKTGKAGRLEPAQERFRDALLAAGQEWYCWFDDSESWEEVKAVLSKGGTVTAT